MNCMKCGKEIVNEMKKVMEMIEKIIEEGKYEELVAKNGFFAELVERQRLDKDQ